MRIIRARTRAVVRDPYLLQVAQTAVMAMLETRSGSDITALRGGDASMRHRRRRARTLDGSAESRRATSSATPDRAESFDGASHTNSSAPPLFHRMVRIAEAILKDRRRESTAASFPSSRSGQPARVVIPRPPRSRTVHTVFPNSSARSPTRADLDRTCASRYWRRSPPRAWAFAALHAARANRDRAA